jgi:hypothetical protein
MQQSFTADPPRVAVRLPRNGHGLVASYQGSYGEPRLFAFTWSADAAYGEDGRAIAASAVTRNGL